VKNVGQKLILAGLLPALALASGCGRKGQQGQFKMPPMPVETATVTQEPIAERFAALGTLEAAEQITVVPEIDGRLVSLPFVEGGQIRKGSLIAQLDDDQLKADAARADAVAAQRKASFERIKSIVDQKAGSPQDLDDAAAALKVAEADLAVAKARLAKAHITAPFDGDLGARHASVGQFMRSGDAITELARLNELRVRFTAPERYLAKLKHGAPVTVTSPAFPGTSLEGKIDVIEPMVDEATRAASIVARVANPEELLRPGMSADVTVILSERPNALVVPSAAVFAQGDQLLVYVIKADSTVAPAPLTLGLRLPEQVEVLAGLAAGDRIVRTGHQKLFPGAKVLPLPAGGMGGPPGAGGPGGPGGPGGAPAGGEGGAKGGAPGAKPGDPGTKAGAPGAKAGGSGAKDSAGAGGAASATPAQGEQR
jgi:membrane fusion protein (multidrug efflux system)